MDRLDVTVHGKFIDAADLSTFEHSVSNDARSLDWPDEDLPSATLRFEELLIRRALARCGGNRAEAARMLNIHRQMLYTKMKRLGIEVSDDKTPDVLEPDE
jgi:DNA-binding NtrC family response regulator